MIEQGILAAGVRLSTPWPPPVPRQLFRRDEDGESIVLFADTLGCVLAVFENRESQRTAYQFGPLPFDAAARLTLVLTWSAGRVSLLVGDSSGPREYEGQPCRAEVPQFPPAPSRAAERIYAQLVPESALTREGRLFLATVRDLDEKMAAADEYSVLMASGLLRKLLLEGLIHVANRAHRLELRFHTIDFTRTPPIPSDTSWSDLDPSAFPGAPTKACTLDEFLAAPCMEGKGHTASVKDVISACAHAKGAVHLGKPRTDEERAVLDWDEVVQLLGREASLWVMAGVCRVVLNALQDLVAAVQRGTRVV
jgi:hypothetical protein